MIAKQFHPDHRYTDPATKKLYSCKTAFQVRIKPGDYDVGPETVGARKKGETIDEHISNNELEWMTQTRGVIILYGVLLRMEEK